jgi:hypothetical protein
MEAGEMRADAPATAPTFGLRTRRPVRSLRGGAALLLVVTLSACFEEPVEERLHLCFLEDGTLVVTAVTRVNQVPGGDSNPALKRRLDEVRRSLEQGDDDWRRRFRALEPLVERLVLDHVAGEVTEVRRSAAGVDAAGLRAFFADSGVSALLEIAEGRAELSLAPGASQRSTHEQRKTVDAALGRWTALLARYAADVGALYGYLDTRPERARACFTVLFATLTRTRGESLDEREATLVKAVEDDIDEAVQVFDVADSEVYTVNEMSHLVFDPFPARVAVHLAGAALEAEGFRREPDGTLAVPGLGLWEAFESLEGRWLDPDPLLTVVRRQRDRSRPFDLDAFVATPRRAAPPVDEGEVRAEIVRLLTPAPIYRVSWPVAERTEEQEAGDFEWDKVRCP